MHSSVINNRALYHYLHDKATFPINTNLLSFQHKKADIVFFLQQRKKTISAFIIFYGI